MKRMVEKGLKRSGNDAFSRGLPDATLNNHGAEASFSKVVKCAASDEGCCYEKAQMAFGRFNHGWPFFPFAVRRYFSEV